MGDDLTLTTSMHENGFRNIMKTNRITLLLFSLLAYFFLVQPVYGLRCDGRIVEIGEKSSQVARKCGQPDHIEYSQEERIKGKYYYSHRYGRSKENHHPPLLKKEIIQIEEWTYNFGPTKFIRYLSFENDRLTKIELGEKGYYQ